MREVWLRSFVVFVVAASVVGSGCGDDGGPGTDGGSDSGDDAGTDANPPSLDSGVEPGDPGALDVSFGDEGLVTLLVPDATGMYSGIVDVVTVGGWTLAVCNPRFGGDDIKATLLRFNLDGSPDTTFGENGFARLDPGGTVDVLGYELAIDSRGRIVVGAFINDDVGNTYFGAVRTDANGILDTTFGDAGFFQHQFGAEENQSFSMALAEDDDVILGGHYGPPGSAGVKQWALTRVDAAGALDTGFGDAGSLLIDIRGPGAGSGNVADLIALPGGTFLAAGRFVNFDVNAGDKLGLLARVGANGAFDSSFGTSGQTDLDSFEGDEQSMAVSSTGHIHVWIDTLVIERYSSDGVLDTAWGEAGQARLMQAAATLNIDGADRLYAAGRAFASGMTMDAQIVRRAADGSADTEFGIPTVGIDGAQMAPLTIDFLADDRVVLAGGYTAGDEVGLFLARFWP